MKSAARHNRIADSRSSVAGCLSCGSNKNLGSKRYCSIQCRQRLRRTLNVRTGLLKALNVRFATFYFTADTIMLDVMAYGARDIFSFMYPRSSRRKPVDDFSRMADVLGNAWWAEKRRTNRKYLASRQVFNQAQRSEPNCDAVKPLEIKIPNVKDKALIRLKLGKSVLNSPELYRVIKTAYRKQAMTHHPDRGGDAVSFRRIHQAYEELLNWAENPSFVRRRGFPDKWFYDGIANRWVQPTPRRDVRIRKN